MTIPIPSPDAWWSAVLGSGYRGTIDQLDADPARTNEDPDHRWYQISRSSLSYGGSQ